MAICSLCGKDSFETGGWLERVNEKGVMGKWECRPSCEAELSNDNRLLGAITGRENKKENLL